MPPSDILPNALAYSCLSEVAGRVVNLTHSLPQGPIVELYHGNADLQPSLVDLASPPLLGATYRPRIPQFNAVALHRLQYYNIQRSSTQEYIGLGCIPLLAASQRATGHTEVLLHRGRSSQSELVLAAQILLTR